MLVQISPSNSRGAWNRIVMLDASASRANSGGRRFRTAHFIRAWSRGGGRPVLPRAAPQRSPATELKTLLRPEPSTTAAASTTTTSTPAIAAYSSEATERRSAVSSIRIVKYPTIECAPSRAPSCGSKIGCAQQKQAWKQLQDDCGGARYGDDAWSVYQRAVTSEFVG